MAAQMRREGDEGRNAQTVGATTGLIDHKVSPLLPLSLSSWLDSAGAPKLFHELHIHYNAYWSQGRSVPHRHYGREIRVGCRTRRAWVDKTFIFSQLSYSRRLYTPRPISTCMWAAWFHLIWCNSTSTGTESVALEKLFRFYWRLKGKAIRRKKKKNPQLFLPPCTAKFREREMGGIAQKDDPFYHDVCVFSDAVPLGRENWPARDGHLLFWLSRRSSRPPLPNWRLNLIRRRVDIVRARQIWHLFSLTSLNLLVTHSLILAALASTCLASFSLILRCSSTWPSSRLITSRSLTVAWWGDTAVPSVNEFQGDSASCCSMALN